MQRRVLVTFLVARSAVDFLGLMAIASLPSVRELVAIAGWDWMNPTVALTISAASFALLVVFGLTYRRKAVLEVAVIVSVVGVLWILVMMGMGRVILALDALAWLVTVLVYWRIYRIDERSG